MVGFDVEASPLEIPELERYSGDWASAPPSTPPCCASQRSTIR